MTKKGVLLEENFDLKRFFLMIVGMSGWKKLFSFIKKNSSSGGFLTHRGKNSCYFSINYDLSLPFKMMSIEVNDEQSLIRHYLSMRRKKNKYFDLMADKYTELVGFLEKVDENLIFENKIGEVENSEKWDFRLFALELFKILSPIFQSYNNRHSKHFKVEKDFEKTNEIVFQIKQKIQRLEDRCLLLETELEKENTVWRKDIKYLAEKLLEYKVSDDDQREVKIILKRASKKNNDPLSERIPESSVFPWMKKVVIENFL